MSLEGRCASFRGERPRFSPTQYRVLECMALGFSGLETAKRLVIAENTVKVHKRNIYAKADPTSEKSFEAAMCIAVKASIVDRKIDVESLKDKSSDRLTQREIEILQLLSRGTEREEVASNLSISINTLKRHLANIYSKLGAHDVFHAVAISVVVPQKPRSRPAYTVPVGALKTLWEGSSLRDAALYASGITGEKIKSGRRRIFNRKRMMEETLRVAREGNVQPREVPEEVRQSLTQRELQILSLIVKGKTALEMSRELHVSVDTIKVQKKNLYKKIGARNLYAAAAITIGLAIAVGVIKRRSKENPDKSDVS